MLTINESFADECIFTANIEKTWVNFGDRPYVFGTVKNCDSNDIYKKDFVFVKILDEDGNLVDDKWQPDKVTAKTNKPTKYAWNDNVYRGGGLGMNADVSEERTIYIDKDTYFFYMPQITQIDFKHRGVYQLEVKYGDHTIFVNFATLSPDIFYATEIEEYCETQADRTKYLENTIKAMKGDLERVENRPMIHQKYLDKITEYQEEIEAFSKYC